VNNQQFSCPALFWSQRADCDGQITSGHRSRCPGIAFAPLRSLDGLAVDARKFALLRPHGLWSGVTQFAWGNRVKYGDCQRVGGSMLAGS
jgi:hypothetical protein